MSEFSYEIKIPKDRVAVLIGKNGATKKMLERATNMKMDIDSDEGDVFIKGSDALNLYQTREIVIAIGRGFNPETALLLLKEEYIFEPLNLKEFMRNKNDLDRLRGRVIGRKGKSRKLIEELTETYVSVYGKTISIIGEAENVGIARRAIVSLLQGSPHGNVYNWLERQRRELKRRQMLEMSGFRNPEHAQKHGF